MIFFVLVELNIFKRKNCTLYKKNIEKIVGVIKGFIYLLKIVECTIYGTPCNNSKSYYKYIRTQIIHFLFHV
jgi:hypothetical protein